MDQKNNYSDTFNSYYKTYYPAFVLASIPRALKRPVGGPFAPGCLLCGSFGAVGGLAIGSGDLANGSGISTAWSLAYLMINGKKSIKSFRLYPLALCTFAGINTIGYGRTIFQE
ncbi:mitochondrial membrane protein,TMEM14 superfamily member Aim19 [Schizosaccharomyces osmophilus]|uniref:Mitochondrial membrane protein,TMEM14 superfamily member Aim19 n=1 Tax=Schizosaccharomyces osmophilus TaxID=2545709 RepID=A0AAF0AVL4_9SCHI|nr:mitochondrial membrane protein,TMEM14 superfamily member Aim19 [Schizosaccharomyces osmophilus]WBW72094.1 mitochondrial membrane protein,TMEM14 superfamily member Aim19 [Schizosaccharomyces osmophilus]